MKSFLSIRDLKGFSKPLSFLDLTTIVFLSQSEATIRTSSEFSYQAGGIDIQCSGCDT